MKHKTKMMVITSMSFSLLSVMQIATASTEQVTPVTVMELTDSSMDIITAGSRSSAGADATAFGRLTSATTRTTTNANRYTNYGVGSGVATGEQASTGASASASGNVVRTRGRHMSGRGFSATWAAAYGY